MNCSAQVLIRDPRMQRREKKESGAFVGVIIVVLVHLRRKIQENLKKVVETLTSCWKILETKEICWINNRKKLSKQRKSAENLLPLEVVFDQKLIFFIQQLTLKIFENEKHLIKIIKN